MCTYTRTLQVPRPRGFPWGFSLWEPRLFFAYFVRRFVWRDRSQLELHVSRAVRSFSQLVFANARRCVGRSFPLADVWDIRGLGRDCRGKMEKGRIVSFFCFFNQRLSTATLNGIGHVFRLFHYLKDVCKVTPTLTFLTREWHCGNGDQTVLYRSAWLLSVMHIRRRWELFHLAARRLPTRWRFLAGDGSLRPGARYTWKRCSG